MSDNTTPAVAEAYEKIRDDLDTLTGDIGSASLLVTFIVMRETEVEGQQPLSPDFVGALFALGNLLDAFKARSSAMVHRMMELENGGPAMTSTPEPVTIEGVMRSLEAETAKLDSLQSLCGVVAETTDTVSDQAMAGALFAIMNNVEAIKERMGGIVHQLMMLRPKGGES